jgi:hypothetical protein
MTRLESFVAVARVEAAAMQHGGDAPPQIINAADANPPWHDNIKRCHVAIPCSQRESVLR